jgi:hypothetical protein
MPHILGVIPLVGRGSLVHRSLSGAPLVDRAVMLASSVCSEIVIITGPDDEASLTPHAGADVLCLPDDDAALQHRLAAADQVVVHDPLCPLVPERFLRSMVAGSGSRTVAAVRPVVDTIKATEDGVIAGTVDRDRLRVVSSPVVMPAAVMRGLAQLDTLLADLSVLVTVLRSCADVEFVIAPSSARRIEDSSGLRLMASVDAVSHRTRERN